MISIIDDDESISAATSCLLRSHGFVAQAFASARAFLQSAHVDDASCLIVDVQMPGMSGVELQSALLSQKRRTPIIFISAYGDVPITVRAMKAGAVEFLTKPFVDDVLLSAVRVAIDRSDDIIKTRGEKVSPIEVENCLHGIPGVREALIGVFEPEITEQIEPVVDRDDDHVRALTAHLTRVPRWRVALRP